jgi:hypothetical protein
MSFDSRERAILGRLADVLIPAADSFPSASQADVAGRWLDQVLMARPDLAAALKGLLAKVGDAEPSWAVAELRSSDPTAFGVLTEFAAGAYFMNPDVLRAIGYAGQDARPIDPRPDYLDDDLLQSVIDRGPIYRPTPSDNG